MVKRFLVFILSLIPLFAQVTYSPSIAPVAGTPAKLTATVGTAPNVVTCTVTGNAIPATALTFTCSLGSIAIVPYTVPFNLGSAYTLQHNYMGNALTIIATAITLPINVTATVNAGPAIGGVF